MTANGETEQTVQCEVFNVNLECDDCETKFFNLIDLYFHRRLHNFERKMTKLAFPLKHVLNIIFKPEDTPFPMFKFKCDLCEKSFGTKQQVVHHRYVHTGEKPYKCKLCPKGFAHPSGLRRHLKTHPEANEPLFKCNVCEKSFSERKCLAYHMANHTGDRPYPCQFCDKRFVRPHDLRRHLEIHQRTDRKPFKCDICSKNFSTKAYLNTHKRLHSTEDSYACRYCGRRFTHKGIFEQHEERHINNSYLPSHQCNLCPRKFFSEKYLKYHLLKHAGEGEHSCNFCGKKYGRLTDLQKHSRMHTTPPPYYQCDVCSMGFTSRKKYKAHTATHVKYTCVVCNRSFYSLKYMELHKLSHTGEQPFPCIYCPKRFIRNDHLKKHIKRQHPPVED